jgi:peptidoglycan hydrolase-like protein with peptidoglycan-binding domain
MSGNSEQVKAIQQALKDQGHDPGEIDGIMGPKTEAALRDYQQKQGLKATGHLDAETSAKLGVEAKTSAAPSSSSSPAASPSTSAPSSSDTKAKSDTGMKSDSSTKSDSATKPGNKADTSAKPSDNEQK